MSVYLSRANRIEPNRIHGEIYLMGMVKGMNRKKEKQSVRHRHIVMSRFFFFVYRLAHFAALAFFFSLKPDPKPLWGINQNENIETLVITC